jgi:hypothetical protein
MIHWLYRYVFRGIGILLVIGMITILFLALNSHNRPPVKHPASAAKGGPR